MRVSNIGKRKKTLKKLPGSQLLSDVQTFLSLGTAGLVLILNSSDLVFFNQKSLILPKNRPISVNNPIFIRLFYKIFTPVTNDIWQHDKQSLSSLHMKTKVVQHVPRIHTPQSRTEKNIFFKTYLFFYPGNTGVPIWDEYNLKFKLVSFPVALEY